MNTRLKLETGFQSAIFMASLILLIVLLSCSNSYASVEDEATQTAADGTEEVNGTDQPADESPVIESVQTASAGTGLKEEAMLDWTIKPVQITPAGNTGSAATSIPIVVPPGIKGIEPRISLNYSSNSGNGWTGIGWSLDMGAIQRSTKRGVNYNANDYIAAISGATAELVRRSSWDVIINGIPYEGYEAKIEGAFSKYYKNTSNGGWEVISKDGTKYYYGTTTDSRRDSAQGAFTWCLDKVQDTNGNYMTIAYWKDTANGEIYLQRIDYTWNAAGLDAKSYVKFYRGSRTDPPVVYTSHARVKTAYRLKSIEIGSNSSIVRAYKITYSENMILNKSRLSTVEQFGNDGTLTVNSTGDISGGVKLSLLPLAFGWQDGCSGLFDSDNSISWAGGGNPSDRWFALADVSGDGMADAVLYEPNSSIIRVSLSKGDGTFADNQDSSWVGGGDSSDRWIDLADINGDGISDAVLYEPANAAFNITYCSSKSPDLLTSIANSIGGMTTLEYRPSSIYDNCMDVDGKNVCLPFVLNTLASVTVDDGNGVPTVSAYEYSGGYFEYADREYRGFKILKAASLYNYNPGNGACIDYTDYDCTVTESSFKQDDIFKGLLERQETRGSSDNIYAKTENFYLHTEPYSGVVFPYLNQKDDYVYDGSSSYKQASTYFDYDGYGNIQWKYFEGDTSVTGDEREEFIFYEEIADKWIVSLPNGMSVEDGHETTVAEQWLTYDQNTGNLIKKEVWLEGGANPGTHYENYDVFGNATQIREARGKLSGITYEYLTDYLKVTATNAMGHTFIKKYDYGFGNVIEETGPNGYSTTYRYDAFGRTLKVIGPLDSENYPSISYEYPLPSEYGQVGVQKMKTNARERHGEAGTIWSESYFDGLGRTFRTETKGPDSKVIAARTIYNDRGLVGQTSAPYFRDIDTPKYTTAQYDPIGRHTMTTYPDGTTSAAIYYLGTLTTIDPNGHQRVEIKDIYGRVMEVQEYKGTYPDAVLYATTTYSYDTTGNLKYTKDSQGNETFIDYDTLSRKKEMDDPNMGIWYYDYDANGNLTYQKDAKDQVLLFEYDDLNRIKKKTYPDGSSIDYKYDQYDDGSSTNAKGRLTKLTDLAGVTAYRYDELGNTIRTDKTIGTATYTTQTTYDALGRTETLTYPDNPANPTVIKYMYGTGGELLNVQNLTNSTIMASYSDYNALGQIGKIEYGNGMTTEYSYYDAVNETNRLILQRIFIYPLQRPTPFSCVSGKRHSFFSCSSSLFPVRTRS